MEQLGEFIVGLLKTAGTTILEAAALFAAGLLVIKLVTRLTQAILYRTKPEGTAKAFIVSLVNAGLGLLLFFGIMRVFKIDTTSIAAIAAAAGIAVGLALQETLSNLASGVILLVNKPFAVGDRIKVGSSEGTVKRIKIISTELMTTDNIVITIPNKTLLGGEVVNFSARPVRRLSLSVLVAPNSDTQKIKSILIALTENDERVMTAPAPSVRFAMENGKELKCSLMVWTKQEHYWILNSDMTERIVEKFNIHNIKFSPSKVEIEMKGGENV